MSEMKSVAISEEHLELLEQIRKKRGNRSYYETINQIVEEEHKRNK